MAMAIGISYQTRPSSLQGGQLASPARLQLDVTFSPSCSQRHVVSSGETLSSIAPQFHISWTDLATFNHLAQPNLLQVGQTLCIPPARATFARSGSSTSVHPPSTQAIVGQSNSFPYPQCTWWANERYHQLHHVYVPWSTSADAWQWPARAAEYGWSVSSTPTTGSIIALQGDEQGALGLGHVGVVEKILPNGHVITSNMNWGTSPTTVTTVEFVPGPRVSFLTNATFFL